jgi:hypothetical protein
MRVELSKMCFVKPFLHLYDKIQKKSLKGKLAFSKADSKSSLDKPFISSKN